MSEIDQFWSGASADGRARYTNVKLIGAGAYSVVGRAEDAVTGERVAIKRIGEVFYDALEAKKVFAALRAFLPTRNDPVGADWWLCLRESHPGLEAQGGMTQ